MNQRSVRFEVSSPGGRLDQVLAHQIEDISRSRIQRFIRSGEVRVDGAVIIKNGHKLLGGEWIDLIIPAPRPSDLQAESIPLDVVFENEDLILVNKPAGMVVHPSAGHQHGTLVHAMLAHAPTIRGIGDVMRPGVVHRLDKDTSGLIVLAKHDRIHQWLQSQFKDRTIEKEYLAIVDGQPPTPTGRIEALIGRDPKHRKQLTVVPPGKGREAITHYQTLESYPEHAFLELKPETGRTHQLRIHMTFLGCPITGDRIYGKRRSSLKTDRHLLHASQLTLRISEEDQPRSFEASLPDDFLQALETLRRG